MKIIERVTLVLFSYVMLILAIILCLIVFGWLDLKVVHSLIEYGINDHSISTAILVLSVFTILLAIKCIFFNANEKEIVKQREGIILENSDGKLLISKDTIESLIESVAKGFNGAENVISKVVVDKDNNLNVYVTLYVHRDAVIVDLSSNLQVKIKEAIKKTSNLEVKEVNIKIKDIAPEEKIIEG